MEYSWNMEAHTNNNAYAKRNPTAIILTEMAFILVSGLEMTVSRCEIIISRFAITISHLEINFTTPSGNNPLAATIKPHNSTTIPRATSTIPHNSTTIPRATSTIPHTSTTIPHNSTTIPHISTTIPHNSTTNPRATSRLGVITPVPLPCPTAIGMDVSWLSPPSAPPTTPTNLANPCRESVKMGAAAIKSVTNTINRAPTALIMYII